MDILKVASLLDNLGSYVLSDKLYKIAETYVPPVEYYSGVDKRHYNEFKSPGNKSYNQMKTFEQMKSRNTEVPQQSNETVVMDGSMYYDNPYTPKEILELRNLAPNLNFRNYLKRYYSGDNSLNSSNPRSFATSLWEFARKNKMNYSLTDAFDAYADSGATYKGQNIKNIPELKELYLNIKSNAKKFSETEVGDILEDLFAGK
jgi:hypothetical protein